MGRYDRECSLNEAKKKSIQKRRKVDMLNVFVKATGREAVVGKIIWHWICGNWRNGFRHDSE